MLRRKFCISFAIAGLMATSSVANAMTNSQLARQSMLKISNASTGTETFLGVDNWAKMPTHTLRTVTPWTDGIIEFEGVYLQDLVAEFGENSKNGRARAFNDYQIEFELDDVLSKGGFLAFKRDGQEMSRRDKGPYWIIFPWSDRPELDTRAVHGLSIWQLVDLSFN